MTNEEYKKLTLINAHKLILENKITSEDLVKFSVAVIDEEGRGFNAFIEVFKDVSHNAFTFDNTNVQGDTEPNVLGGIPMAIKDNIVIQGKKAEAGSHIMNGYVAPYTGTVIGDIMNRGGIVVGRTNMDEFAMGSSTETSYFGPSKNPHDITRVPGGSSGGSAVAVAAGLVIYSLGSDTGGSVRQPASFCGIVGLKPTYGAYSRYGVFAMGSSLDQIGIFSKTCHDAKLIHAQISRHDTMDGTSVPEADRIHLKTGSGKTIGVPWSFVNSEGVSEEVKEVFYKKVQDFKSKGYNIIDISIPHIEKCISIYHILMSAEASSNLARYDGVRFGLHEKGDDLLESYIKTKEAGFGEEVKRRLLLGTYVLSSGYKDAYYYKAREVQDMLKDTVKKTFEMVDFIVTPTTPDIAFKFGEHEDPLSMYIADLFTVPANILGLPAISVPVGKGKISKMPIGIHIMGPEWSETALCDMASEVEESDFV